MEPFPLLSIAFPLVGIGLIAAAVRDLRRQQSFLRRARRVRGVVVEQRLGAVGGQSVDLVYYPVVRFPTDDGRTVTFVSGVGTMPAGTVPGSDVGVLYDPDQPTEARIDSFVQTKGRAVILIVLGCGFLFMGLLFLATTWAFSRLPGL